MKLCSSAKPSSHLCRVIKGATDLKTHGLDHRQSISKYAALVSLSAPPSTSWLHVMNNGQSIAKPVPQTSKETGAALMNEQSRVSISLQVQFITIL